MGPRRNKRSPVEHDKFLLSARWLCKKLLAVNAAHMGASTRISKENPEQSDWYSDYDVTRMGRCGLETSEGNQTKYRPGYAFLKHFEVISSTLSKQLVRYEDKDPIVVQVATESSMHSNQAKIT